MARKQPKPEKRGRTGKPIQVYLSDELSAALDAYVEATRPKSTKTAVIEMALEDLLRRSGDLPPAEGEGKGKGGAG
jgi:hypothetical protein